jgi:hypothetical protein
MPFENTLRNQRETNKDEELSVDEFMRRMLVSGKYAAGSESRVSYIKAHQADINRYIANVRDDRPAEADLLQIRINMNSTPRLQRNMSPNDRLEKADLSELVYSKRYEKKERITRYSSKPREAINRLIFPIILISAIPIAFYVGEKCKLKIEKAIHPYTQKIYELYHEIDGSGR